MRHVHALLATAVICSAVPASFASIRDGRATGYSARVEARTTRAIARWTARHCAFHMSRGELAEALKHANTSISRNVDDAAAYATRADVRSLLGDFVGALGDADYAVGLNPVLPSAYFHRAHVYSRAGSWRAAADDLTALNFLDPTFRQGEAHFELGVALLELRDYRKSIVSFTRAIGSRASFSRAYFLRSFAYEAEGETTSAISDLNATLQSEPTYPGAHFRRAILFLRQRNEAQARIDLRRAWELDPQNASIAAAARSLLGH